MNTPFIPAARRLTRIERQQRETLAYVILILCFAVTLLGAFYGAWLGDKWAMVYYAIPGLVLVWMELLVVAKTDWLERR